MKSNRIRRRLRTSWKKLPGVALELLNPFELLDLVFDEPGTGLAGLALAGALTLVLLIAAASFGIVCDSFDRTPLQTLGLK
ncbi:MAG TPA: hypothetical protein VJN64_13010 [Terriglobales bacterium]|nr:hypothetical protein [Terriglobales bacterium]